jgi:anti-sigma factor RsiW
MADEIRTCRDAEALLAPYVDGEVTDEGRRGMDAHLNRCPPCLDQAEAERSAKDLVCQHREALRGAAPPELRSRCAALDQSRFRPAAPVVSRRAALLRRWAPLSVAATLVLAVAGVFVSGLNNRVEALAASLAVDHVKCFKVGSTPAHAEAGAASEHWQQVHGWAIAVPDSEAGQQLTLIDVRRCFSTDGRAAHMMYTWRGEPLSVYVLPENMGRDQIVDRMGHEAVIWCANQRTYAVVTAGHPPDLGLVVDYMKAHAK